MNRLQLLFFAAAIVVSTGAMPAIQRQHGAHVHGTTTIDIAEDGKLLSFKFEMPGVNAVGYEHPPHNDEERAQLNVALAVLRAPGTWLVPNAEARCRLTQTNVEPNGFDEPKVAPAGAKAKGEHEHADIDVGYLFECEAPLNLRSVELDLIDRFPGTHVVNVNAALGSGQAQETFTTPHATITFSPASP
jgi:hypothetical protein